LLSGILSWYSNGPTSRGSICRARKKSRIASCTSPLTRQSSPAGSATRTSPRSSAAITSSVLTPTPSSLRRCSPHLAQDLRRPLALLLCRNEGEPCVALTGVAEERTGCDDDAVRQEPTRELLRRAADVDPQIKRRRRAGRAQPALLERRQQRVALAAVERPHVLDMPLVRPGRDGGTLDELLRRCAHGRPERTQRVADLGRRADEAGAVPGH